MQGRDSIKSGGKIGFRGNSCMNMCKDMCGHITYYVCVYAYCTYRFVHVCMYVCRQLLWICHSDWCCWKFVPTSNFGSKAFSPSYLGFRGYSLLSFIPI